MYRWSCYKCRYHFTLFTKWECDCNFKCKCGCNSFLNFFSSFMSICKSWSEHSRSTLFNQNEAIQIFSIYLANTPGNYLPTSLGRFLSADYPRPHGTTISRLPLFCNLSPDYPAWGSREIVYTFGVVGR